MKRLLNCITALIILFIGTNNFDVVAESINYTDGLIFTMTTNASTNEQYYTISSYKGTETEITLPDTYNGYPVKVIGYSAFANSDITTINFSNSITTISPNAFKECKNLTSLVFPQNLESILANAFRGCTQLSEIQFNYELKEIGSQAFLGCTNIKKIFIPENVIDISMSAFMDCISLSEVTGCEGLTKVSSQLFSGCENLYTVNIGENTKEIGSNAFSGCKELLNIVIPDTVEYIASGAFPNYIPFISNQSTEIKYAGRWIIDCDKNATNFLVKEGTIGICSSAFSNCENLYKITLPSTIKYIGSHAFEGTPLLNQQDTEIKYADKWVIGCDKSIVKATIENETVGICGYAFSDCTKMQSVSIPDSVKYIGEYAFNNCTMLDSVYIPKLVSLIGDCLFSMCNKLEVVHLCESNEYVKAYMLKQYPGILLEYYADTIVLGDVNADGAFNISDIVVMQKWLLTVSDATLVDWKAGDLCEDDVLNVFDLCLMRRKLIEQ